MLTLAGCQPVHGARSTDRPLDSRPHGGAEILWDRFGVPHITAKSMPAVGYALGWAQAQNHGNLLLQLFGQARGRSAEYWGGAANVAEDRWVHRIGGVQAGDRSYDRLAPSMKVYVDAYASGINAYVAAHAGRIADSVKLVLPVTGRDVQAHQARLLYAHFLSTAQSGGAVTQRWQERGSNAWAIAPSRSASRNPMLLQNPHLPWSGAFTWMEAQLAYPGVDVYGATLVGVPVISIGFNDRLGWTHTVNTTDNEDYYELKLSGAGYLLDGREQPFVVDTQDIRVKRAQGGYDVEQLVTRRSVHGPVLSAQRGKAIALRVTGLDRLGTIEQWWQMGRARTVKEFEAALAMLQVSGQNTVYADADGHILYFYGNVPDRRGGDVSFWAGIVRGDTTATLWSGILPYAAVPRVRDPAVGFVQNTNDAPWYATFPATLIPTAFPSHVAPRGLSLRSARSLRMLTQDSSITFDELVQYKHSTRLELADRVLDDLLAAAVENGDPCARDQLRTRCDALRALRAWDRTANATSAGTPLFVEWWQDYVRQTVAGGPFAVAWTEQDPLRTPRGLRDPAAAVRALDAAAARAGARVGGVLTTWGTFARLRRDSVDLPANGSTGALGVFRVTTMEAVPGGSLRAAGGDSYVGVVEFGRPIRAQTLIGYGNASQPGSPHRTDQLSFYALQMLRPVWRTRQEIMANLHSQHQF
ncbi:MAG: acylase [Gemmatimonadota bacterium]